MNTIKKYFCDIYILTWCAYLLQRNLDIRGSIAQNLFLILVLISLAYVIYVIFKVKKSIYVKGLLAVLLMAIVYGSYSMMTRSYIIARYADYTQYTSFAYLQMFFRSLLPFFVFYTITLKRSFSNFALLRFFCYFLITYILGFYYLVFQDQWSTGELNGTFNIGYRIMGLIPMLYIININKNAKLLLLLIIITLVVLSSKRGAIFTGIVLFLIYLKNDYKKITTRRFVMATVLLVVLSSYLYNFFLEMFWQSAGMQSKFAKTLAGDTNGRDDIYNFFYNYIFTNNSFVHFLFGNGADSTLTTLGQYAHNDWLEIGMNQGLLGILIYLFYWICFYKQWKIGNKNSNYDHCIFSILLAYFLISFFSMSINDMPHCATFALAYAINMKQREMAEIAVKLYKI